MLNLPSSRTALAVTAAVLAPLALGMSYLIPCLTRAPNASPNSHPTWKEVLLHPKSIILYSLDPGNYMPIQGQETFHNYKVLGKMDITGQLAWKAANEFLLALRSFSKSTLTADCFNPRHGIRISVNHQTYDYLLCYQCRKMMIFENNHEPIAQNTAGQPDVLNKMLSESNIQIAY